MLIELISLEAFQKKAWPNKSRKHFIDKEGPRFIFNRGQDVKIIGKDTDGRAGEWREG